MIQDVLRERAALGIIPATSDNPRQLELPFEEDPPSEVQKVIDGIKRRLDRMRATEARATGLFVKYDRIA